MGSAIHLKQTDAFVAQRPVEIVLHRETKVPDGAGGWKTNANTAIAAQTFRLVPIGRVGALSTRTTPDGRIVTPTMSLVGTPPKDVEELDTFSIGEDNYEVVFVSRLPEWRVTAEVIQHRG